MNCAPSFLNNVKHYFQCLLETWQIRAFTLNGFMNMEVVYDYFMRSYLDS